MNTKQINIFKTGQHLLFWVVSYLFFILFFGRANRDYQTTIIFTSMLFPLAIVTAYFLNYYLIPRFLYHALYWRFLLYLLYTLVFTFWFEVIITMFIFIVILNFEFSKLDPASFDTVFLMVGLYFIILGFVSIEQIKRAFEIKKENTRLEKQKLETELKLRESELKLLRAQIHPHFLFNTLNNLYGLTLEKSNLAPELVLKLSDLMDYMLYKCNKPMVLLQNELEHIENYIEIERIRYHENVQIDFQIEGKPDGLEIAPMLLIPFVENAFKHGISKQINQPFVIIDVQIVENNFKLQVVNSYNKNAKKLEAYSEGIGLKNVKKRLQLLYPDKYKLDIVEQEEIFSLNLDLNLKKAD